jgi:hypothetical protein
MNNGWTDSDKRIVKTALERARKRAEKEVLKRFRDSPVESVEDLWAMELTIRQWRKECGSGRFYFAYERVEELLGEFLARGWTLETDLSSLSEERLENIKLYQKKFANALRR